MTSDNMKIYDHLLTVREDRGAGFFLLIDPDKSHPKSCVWTAEIAGESGVDALLVGSSTMMSDRFGEVLKAVKEASAVPVIIFPGSFAQIRPDADAVLFTSLVSGRNPNFLIDEQVKGAPLVKQYGLEAIPTAYMIIESGTQTSVQYVSNTQPIPRDKSDLAVAHALAAQYMGMRFVYLESGSGAQQAVPTEMIAAVDTSVDIPIIVGGGLRQPQDCAERIEAGASFVVVGNSFEKKPDAAMLSEMAASVHTRESIQV